MSRRLELKDFIERARKIHGKKYGYGAVKYRNIDSKVKIKCPIHGYFLQTPWVHIGRAKSGCPKCGDLRTASKLRAENERNFVRDARRVHGRKYDYSAVVYVAMQKKIKVICPEHGEFFQTPESHIRMKSECPKCGHRKAGLSRRERHRKLFAKKAKKVHGNLYDYSASFYEASAKPIQIRCKEHGVFTQAANNHLNGYGCPKCGADQLRKNFAFTNREFLKKARSVHGRRFSYLSKYFNSLTPVKIKCKKHGLFTQKPADHLGGAGCVKCSNERAGLKQRSTHREFVAKAKRIFPQYSYPEKYKTAVYKIAVGCPTHGLFKARPNSLLSGSGCPKCAFQKTAERILITHDEFVKRCKEVHGRKFTYPEKYQGMHFKIRIICPKHGAFVQGAMHHLRGQGCPICFESTGERAVANILKRMNVRFIRQKRFPDLEHRRPLRFDFWLPSLKTLVEFDGIQHFEASTFFGGEKAFTQTKERDQIKNSWAKRMKLPLIRIPYFHKKPEHILRKKLKI